MRHIRLPFNTFPQVLSKLCHSAKRVMSSSTLANTASNLDPKQLELMDEVCISVDENDKPLGPKSKKDCHLMANIDNGLLHRAFSLMLFNSKGEFLITQRSDAKITFPSYITNTCCSHPLFNDLEMDETDAIGVKRAAQRRLQIELGIDALKIPLDDITYMTRFLYKAPSGGEWGEHEIDYALVIQKDVELNPDPNEVKSYKFVAKDELLPYLKSQEKLGNRATPWFQLMVDHFLFDWWNNLNDLKKFQDHHNIHRLP